MRILHIGVCAKSESLPRYFRKYATVYDEFQPHEAVDNGKDYDFCFIQIQNDKIGNEQTIKKLAWVKRLKDNGCKIINWNGDKRSYTPKWMVDFAPYVSYTCFSNMEDVNHFHKLGLPSYFLQIGIDNEIFKPLNLERNGVVFLANNYGNQFPLGGFRRDVARYLKQRKDFKLYGNGWTFADGSVNHSQHEENKVYNQAKYAISISHFDSERYTSDRLLRAMASGVCCIVHHYRGLETDFKPNEDFFTFKKIEELNNILCTSEDQRKKVANQGLQKSKKFTYDSMIKNMFKICGLDAK